MGAVGAAALILRKVHIVTLLYIQKSFYLLFLEAYLKICTHGFKILTRPLQRRKIPVFPSRILIDILRNTLCTDKNVLNSRVYLMIKLTTLQLFGIESNIQKMYQIFLKKNGPICVKNYIYAVKIGTAQV